ncbi:hypothetical protein OAT22_02920 [Porticoccaceae bacterium]|nr:hypothetical protein [Porticoccaceae bacterium]MDG2116454.1 hypothetical protein [Porticoccaceae bacterium]
MRRLQKQMMSGMERVRRVFLVAIISAIVTALLAAFAAGTAHANPSLANMTDSKKALARLVKDIDLLRPALAAKSESTADGYYLIRRGETLDGIIARTLPDLPLRKNILQQAIVLANPHAFKRKNPNWMYAGKRIKLPGAEEIHHVIFTQSRDKLDSAKISREERKSWVHYP